MEAFESLFGTSPVFIALVVAAILVESYLYQRRFHRGYPWQDTLTSLGVGLGHNLTGIVNQILIVGLMGSFVWSHRLVTLPMDTAWVYVLLFFSLEFAYYWYHRLSHEMALMWATHSTHHTPNEITFSAAIRLGWTPFLSFSWVFFLPLVWLGFHPALVFGLLGLSLAYQFWLHTRLIPPLGFLEGILNTPSAHRVHHASNDIYLDRNYGGILIIFDRLFGTYQVELNEVPLVFGLTHPIETHNPFLVVFHVWRKLIDKFLTVKGYRNKCRALFDRPGWLPPEMADVQENPE